MNTFKVSVVVPAYNEQGNLPVLLDKLTKTLARYRSYEIILVNDGSCDETLTVMKDLHHKNPAVHYISLSRNFGHQYALKAGLDRAEGDCVISMDADLQHPVELIEQMIERWQKGADIVYTVRRDKKTESAFKRLTSNVFYKVFNALSGLKVPAGAAD
ncbi:MAG: glycosyltransferase family 2 protein, partial [Alphaproteobacteria bacterium]